MILYICYNYCIVKQLFDEIGSNLLLIDKQLEKEKPKAKENGGN